MRSLMQDYVYCIYLVVLAQEALVTCVDTTAIPPSSLVFTVTVGGVAWRPPKLSLDLRGKRPCVLRVGPVAKKRANNRPHTHSMRPGILSHLRAQRGVDACLHFFGTPVTVGSTARTSAFVMTNRSGLTVTGQTTCRAL
jgi:hypothetical protein